MYSCKGMIGKKMKKSNNKYIGTIKELYIDPEKKCISGFKIKKHFKIKKLFVICNNINFDKNYVFCDDYKECADIFGIPLSNIIMIDIEDDKEHLLGDVKDLLIKDDTKDIVGIVCNEGFLNKFINGYDVYSTKDVKFAENKIIYNNNTKITFKRVFHKIGGV